MVVSLRRLDPGLNLYHRNGETGAESPQEGWGRITRAAKRDVGTMKVVVIYEHWAYKKWRGVRLLAPLLDTPLTHSRIGRFIFKKAF